MKIGRMAAELGQLAFNLGVNLAQEKGQGDSYKGVPYATLAVQCEAEEAALAVDLCVREVRLQVENLNADRLVVLTPFTIQPLRDGSIDMFIDLVFVCGDQPKIPPKGKLWIGPDDLVAKFREAPWKP